MRSGIGTIAHDTYIRLICHVAYEVVLVVKGGITCGERSRTTASWRRHILGLGEAVEVSLAGC